MRAWRRKAGWSLFAFGIALTLLGVGLRQSNEWDFAAYKDVETEEDLKAIIAIEKSEDRTYDRVAAIGITACAIGVAMLRLREAKAT